MVAILFTVCEFDGAHAQDPDSEWVGWDFPAVLDSLRSKDPRVRLKSVSFLELAKENEWGGEAGAETVNRVIAALVVASHDVDPDVREAVVNILGSIDDALVISLIHDPDPSVRSSVIAELAPALNNNTNDTTMRNSVQALVLAALQDRAATVRAQAALAFAWSEGGFIDGRVETALLVALWDRDERVRQNAVYALGAQSMLPLGGGSNLQALLSDPNEGVRVEAAYALAKHRIIDPRGVAVLTDAIRTSHDDTLRSRAIEILKYYPPADARLTDALIAAARGGDVSVRYAAIDRLTSSSLHAWRALSVVEEALADTAEVVRHSAVSGLRRWGVQARSAIPSLTGALREGEGAWQNSAEAATSIAAIAEAVQDSADKLSYRDLERVVVALDSAEKVLSDIVSTTRGQFSDGPHTNAKAVVHRSIQHLSAEMETRIVGKAVNWITENPYATGLTIYVLGFLLIWSVLYWVAPLRLLAISDAVGVASDVGLPSWLGKVSLPVHWVLLLSPFRYRPRVLDAWVTFHIDSARERFLAKRTVQDRRIHVPIPAIMGGTFLPELDVIALRPAFNQRRSCLLVWGEGGAGKTSLACQIGLWAMSEDAATRLGEHRMLPVLIEEDLSVIHPERQPFIEAIRGQLGDMIASPLPIRSELLSNLLRNRRILVILDHLSEMSEATRQQIQLGDPEFSVHALIVTSRTEESLDQVNRTTIRPLRIEGNRLSSFMEAYLAQRNVRELFDDEEFFAACGRLSKIVKDRNITVLLAKLYADELIRSKESSTPSTPPESIPDLMRGYVTELNRSVEVGHRPDRDVHRDTRVVAWQCLVNDFRPAPTWRSAALDALASDDAETRLDYLETKLRLVETVGAARDRLRFSLDPLAEYLAALHQVEHLGGDERKWRAFLALLDAHVETPESREGYLLALRDCCRSGMEGIYPPNWLPEELSRRLPSP